ncbi:MAG TPA: hypothetical protein VMD59_22570 [Acidimicrobiales bacterium]|nr:hypothetical protein [Acidimicrobiales bacterium]
MVAVALLGACALAAGSGSLVEKVTRPAAPSGTSGRTPDNSGSTPVQSGRAGGSSLGAGAGSSGQPAAGSGESASGNGSSAGAGAAGAGAAGAEPAGNRVISGDLPAAAGLANVWLELRDTLAVLAGTTLPARPVRLTVARRLAAGPAPKNPNEPDEPEAASS